MALTLNIEKSSEICSVCISKTGEVKDFREDRNKNSHARVLTLLIDELLKSNSIKYNELDAVAVSAGPGSYTGLRIGVTTAKGLCYSLNKPLLLISTLEALTVGIRQKVSEENFFAMPVIDARRNDVYTALYSSDGKEILPAGCETLREELEKKVICLGEIYVGGNATEKCKAVFRSTQIHFTEDIFCDSRHLAKISFEKFQQKNFASLAYSEPFYLKEFQGK